MSAVVSLKTAIQKLATSPTDEEAWRFVYREMRPFILGIVYRRFKDREIAEDAVQEVLFRILRARPFEKISDESALRAYVWRTALNVAHSRLRDAARSSKGKHSFFEWQKLQRIGTSAESAPQEDRFLAEEVLELLMHELDPNDRQFLVVLLSGGTLAEAATKANLSYSNAGVRFHRLKRKLRKLLLQHEKIF